VLRVRRDCLTSMGLDWGRTHQVCSMAWAGSPSPPEAAFLSNSSRGQQGSEPTSTEYAKRFGLRFGFPENQRHPSVCPFQPLVLTCKSTPEAGKLKFFLPPYLGSSSRNNEIYEPGLGLMKQAQVSPRTPSPLLCDFSINTNNSRCGI